MIIILLGPPGSGKGTNSSIICDKYNLFHISTGDLLRERMKQNDELAKKISILLSEGQLVSDEIINNIVANLMKQLIGKNNYKGLLFDGYPRTIKQAEFLEKFLPTIGKKINNVLLFYIPDNTIVQRVSARRIDKTTGKIYNLIFNPPPKNIYHNLEQRADDTEETILQRLKIYHEQTEPLINYYKNKNLIIKINASGNIKQTQNIITIELANINEK